VLGTTDGNYLGARLGTVLGFYPGIKLGTTNLINQI